MGKIVLLCYHGIGHFNPCFHVARALRQKHDVVFAGYSYFQSYVQSQGFAYYPLSSLPFASGFEEWRNKTDKKKFAYLRAVKDRWTDRLYRLRVEELSKLLGDINPDYLLLDSSQATDFIVLYPLLRETKVRVAVFHTTLPTALRAGLPPLNSDSLPGAEVAAALNKFRKERWRKNLWQWIKYFGNPNPVMASRRITANDIPEKYISSSPALYNLSLSGLPEFVFAPIEFDFPLNGSPAQQHYLGLLIDKERKEQADPAFDASLPSIMQQISEGRKLIICSFGTIAYDKRNRITNFFEKLVAAIRSSGYLLVVADPFHESAGLQQPGDVFFFKKIPMLRLLNDAALLITHGGWNSVKESIANRVPMLVYPIDSRTDQKGIAARVEYHRLGLRGKLDKDSTEEIARKINMLVHDPVFKEKIEAMNEHARAYDERRILTLLDGIPPLD